MKIEFLGSEYDELVIANILVGPLDQEKMQQQIWVGAHSWVPSPMADDPPGSDHDYIWKFTHPSDIVHAGAVLRSRWER